VSERSFLILHGLEGSGEGHWQHLLHEDLRERGEDSRFPELSDPDRPVFTTWMAELTAELGAMPAGGERVVLCHSLACVLWLHHAGTAEPAQRVDRVLLVAPPSPRTELPTRGFPPLELDPALPAAAAERTRLVCATGDPYCPERADTIYAGALGIPADVIEDGGHLSTDWGYGDWPAVKAWALEEAVPLRRPPEP
jgi:uncharacterized protein